MYKNYGMFEQHNTKYCEVRTTALTCVCICPQDVAWLQSCPALPDPGNVLLNVTPNLDLEPGVALNKNNTPPNLYILNI